MLRLGVYRTFLWCYPASFRREYGTEMMRAFSAQVRDARDHGGWRAEASIWIRILLDLFLTAPREHAHVMRQDLRYAIRTLASNPSFATVAILSLALGIGANTAIFSLLNSVLISPLPVRAPHELVMLTSPGSSGWGSGLMRGEDRERPFLSYAEFEQLRDESTSFSGLIASQSFLERVQARIDGGEPEEIETRLVSAEYFTTLGVTAVHGRLFASEEARVERGAPYAVISYDYWQRRFGGRSDVLGTRMAIRGGVFSIIGVAPPPFFGETVGQRPDVWLPLSMQAVVLPGDDWLRDKPGDPAKVMWLHVFGRLSPGVTIEQAQADANVVFQRGLATHYGKTALSAEDRKDFLDQRLILRPGARGASTLRGQFSDPLQVLLAAAGVVLIIACANLSNLLLARVTGRNRETSVRLALGASGGRLVRQLLTESMVLAVLGGLAGLCVAFPLRAGLLYLAPEAQLTDRLEAVASSRDGLFSGADSGDTVIVEGYTPRGDDASTWTSVGPRYFSTLGIPVTLGREITERDQHAAQEVCVINEAFAKQFFEGRNPLGMRVTRVFGDERNACQVVGVVRDSRVRGLRGEIERRFYLPLTTPGRVTFAIRTAGEPSSVIADVRRAVRHIDPDLHVTARPLTEILDDQMVQDRLLARLSIAFGVVALLLAAIGLYGVLSYGVTRRTNEIGIRKA
ncbi:MAG: FtsX-like permease family protein, partial [Luteitalea sp.]|nr:FtsX-like permease family protein [Luteitalea sp.]